VAAQNIGFFALSHRTAFDTANSLRYCHQILLQGRVFESTNGISNADQLL
jgi:hypothetical protein